MNWLDYLAGYVLGDGYLYHYAKEGKYFIRMADRDEVFLRHLQKQIYENLGYKGHIYRLGRKNAWVLEYSNKKLYTALSEKIPILLNDPTREFVAGIIDAEGSLQIPKKGSIRLVVVNTNTAILNAVKKILAEIGIMTAVKLYGRKKENERQRYRLIIYGKRNVEKVLKTLPLQHPKFHKPF
ncbi:hypothetical protein CGL51_13545 [Pyrobaculum aerophilum]|uniref:DOD-type homing endonuclease domain-containing protein n=1 Tax=Pyrobaculum aerophilum TaxID=13773 RepID=A0A371QX69_9CREN|nr:hypothetical protein CGL51_13545 [Pyrobaculum aerophilum]RFA94948.1 hypothetical protein CGL52_13710 [Pyrobaculum aerophilum]